MTSLYILLLLFLLVLWLGWLGGRHQGADWGSPVLNRLDGLNRLFCRYYHRLEADRIPLPADGPALLVSNHLSGLDPFLLAAACNRPLHFMIATEQYHRFGLTWFFRWTGCIPVDRDRNPQRAFRAALEALEEGKVIAIFPQGKIRAHPRPGDRLKGGAARMAQLSAAPVCCARISGVRGIGRTVSAPFLRSHARVEAFPPLSCGKMPIRDCLQAIQRCIEPEVFGEEDVSPS